MARFQRPSVRGYGFAETADGDAICVRLEETARKTVGGLMRDVVVYCGPDIDAAQLAALLRELVDRLEEGDP
jgi:hypothetical protein